MKNDLFSLQKKLFQSTIDESESSSEGFLDKNDTAAISQISVYPYKPRAVRYEGKNREGQCRVCFNWYKLRTSSYWYHMNYKHGVSSSNQRISKPSIRRTESSIQGYCTICRKWIDLNSKKINYLFSWYKHFQKYHRGKCTDENNPPNNNTILPPYKLKKYY